jgi:2-C-methyl-D-erythritol 2,4-cyclodiphosphate synthase
MRIGQSTDIHPLVEGRPLILGGVLIPHPKGCLGHSDADALTHFPDTDPKYKGISSLLILQEVVAMMNKKHYKIGNVDALILIERPKMAPHIPAMKEKLCAILQCHEEQLNLKATRGEGLGFIGHEEGVVAQAVVLLEEVC